MFVDCSSPGAELFGFYSTSSWILSVDCWSSLRRSLFIAPTKLHLESPMALFLYGARSTTKTLAGEKEEFNTFDT